MQQKSDRWIKIINKVSNWDCFHLRVNTNAAVKQTKTTKNLLNIRDQRIKPWWISFRPNSLVAINHQVRLIQTKATATANQTWGLDTYESQENHQPLIWDFPHSEQWSHNETSCLGICFNRITGIYNLSPTHKVFFIGGKFNPAAWSDTENEFYYIGYLLLIELRKGTAHQNHR